MFRLTSEGFELGFVRLEGAHTGHEGPKCNLLIVEISDSKSNPRDVIGREKVVMICLNKAWSSLYKE